VRILTFRIAINHVRGWFRNFRGSFDDTGIKSFVGEIMNGRGRNFKLGFNVTLDKKKEAVKDEL
jgi:hypothetical protein